MKKTKLTKKLEEKYVINSMIDFVEGLEKSQEFEEQKLEKWVGEMLGLMLRWPDDGKNGESSEHKKSYLVSVLKDVKREAYKEILGALYKL